jgi:hypothetical protein
MFYEVLQERVEAYFRDNQISKQGSPELWLQAFQTFFFFLLFLCATQLLHYYFFPIDILLKSEVTPPVCVCVCRYVGYIKGSLLGCMFMGWFYSQFGIMIMHDGTHGAFSKNPTICKLASLVCMYAISTGV